uniref:Putative secreted protein n=1 Tax=Anopheles darlingi TaxID=43151 RepID=A0A2M4DS67_ANODA
MVRMVVVVVVLLLLLLLVMMDIETVVVVVVDTVGHATIATGQRCAFPSPVTDAVLLLLLPSSDPAEIG